MTELEWLKQESGMSDDDLKAFEGMLGNAQFKTMLTKLQATKENATAQVKQAETERLNLENQWSTVYQPELRKVTEDALRATGENARLKAQLDKAREYGIVPGEETPRAPGSPDPSAPPPQNMNYASKDDFNKLRDEAGLGLAVINDLNAEHFKLYNSPVPNMTELINEVTRERKLGHSTDLRQVWERKHDVAAKRAEIAAADQKKHDDKIREDALREYVQKNGQNPNTRTGTTSRFSTYDPNAKGDKSMPWQAPNGMKKRANAPWREVASNKIAQATVRSY